MSSFRADWNRYIRRRNSLLEVRSLVSKVGEVVDCQRDSGYVEH